MSTGPSDVTGIKAGPSDPVHITGIDPLSTPLNVQQSTTPVTTVNNPGINTSASALAANPNRRIWTIQNLGTTPLLVRLGAGATLSAFHFSLKAGGTNDDGTGGFFSDETYKGVVSVIPLSGTARYVCIEEV